MRTSLSIYKDDTWWDLDPSDDSIAMNYQANTLGSIEEKNNDYSQVVSLPRTPNNMRILGLGLLPYSESDIPYKAYECEVFADGVSIMPYGASLYVKTLTDDSIEVQITGTEKDLADILEAKPMSDPSFEITWNIEAVSTPLTYLGNGDVQMRWAYITASKDPRDTMNPAFYPFEFITTPGRCVPIVNYWQLVTWILKEEGWTLDASSANVWWWGEYSSQEQRISGAMYCTALSVGAENAMRGGTAAVSSTAYGHGLSYNDTGPQSGEMQFSISEEFPLGQASLVNRQGVNSLRVTFLTGGDVTINCHIESTFSGLPQSVVENTVSTSLYHARDGSQELLQTCTGHDSFTTFTVTVEKGDYITVSGRVAVSSTTYEGTVDVAVEYSTSMTLNMDEMDEDYGVVVGGVYDILACLGFENRLQPVLEFMNLLGLTLRLNRSTRTAYMFTMDKVAEQCTVDDAEDWSDKIVRWNRSVTYTPDDYARTNTVAFAENEDEGWQDTYVFNIDNDALEYSKSVYTSMFLSVRNYTTSINIPIYDYDYDEDTDTYTMSYSSPSAPVLVGFDSGQDNQKQFQITQGTTTQTVNLWLLQAFTIGWFWKNLYDRFEEMLNKWREVEAQFLLTPIDISNLDLSKPVYIEDFGHYYYISKVNNYQYDKLTKVNLIEVV